MKNSTKHQPVFIWGGEGNKNLEENFDLTSSLSLIMFDSQYYFQKIKGINNFPPSTLPGPTIRLLAFLINFDESMISNYESILKYLINFTEKMIL